MKFLVKMTHKNTNERLYLLNKNELENNMAALHGENYKQFFDKVINGETIKLECSHIVKDLFYEYKIANKEDLDRLRKQAITDYAELQAYIDSALNANT